VPDQVGFLRITRPDGTFAYLTSADLASPPDFAEGPALFWIDNGTTTHFFRPMRSSRDENAADNVATTGGAPLVVATHTGNVLKVTADVTPTHLPAQQQVSFSATASGEKSGEQLSYHWHFDDGSAAPGASVQHAFDRAGGYNVFVEVRGDQDSGGSSDVIRVTVGKPPKGSGTRPGGGSTNQQAPGGGPVTGGSGGSGTTTTAPSSSPPITSPPLKPPKPLTSIPQNPPGMQMVRGVLLASSRTVAPGSLLRSPGSPAAARAGSSHHPEVPIAGGAAVLLLALGAAHEGGARMRIRSPWRR
jgi:hypothetical protein